LYALIFNWDINLQFKEKQKKKKKIIWSKPSTYIYICVLDQ
jgi:hypothetical protein